MKIPPATTIGILILVLVCLIGSAFGPPAFAQTGANEQDKVSLDPNDPAVPKRALAILHIFTELGFDSISPRQGRNYIWRLGSRGRFLEGDFIAEASNHSYKMEGQNPDAPSVLRIHVHIGGDLEESRENFFKQRESDLLYGGVFVSCPFTRYIDLGEKGGAEVGVNPAPHLEMICGAVHMSASGPNIVYSFSRMDERKLQKIRAHLDNLAEFAKKVHDKLREKELCACIPRPPLIIVLDIDGLRQDQLYQLLIRKELPNLGRIVGELKTPSASDLIPYDKHTSTDPMHRLEFENAIALLNTTSVFPSFTWPTQASMFTGEPPGVTGMPGNEWLDRSVSPPRQYSFTGNEIGLGDGDVMDAYAAGLSDQKLLCPPVYFLLTQQNVVGNAAVAFNMYYRGAKYLRIGETESAGGVDLETIRQYALYYFELLTYNFDELMVERATLELSNWVAKKNQEKNDKPWVMTLYFTGVDHLSHKEGWYLNRTQEKYMKTVVDPLIGSFLDKLKTWDFLGRTTFIIAADHGHTEVNKDGKLGHVLDSRNGLVLSMNGGLAHVNISNNFEGREWRNNQWKDILDLAEAFSNLNQTGEWNFRRDRNFRLYSRSEDPFTPKNPKDFLDLILVREPSTVTGLQRPYKVYMRGGEPVLLEDFFKGYLGLSLLRDWHWFRPDAADLVIKRIQEMNSDRSGDIVLLPKYPEYYFDHGKVKGEHGSIHASDMLVPFIVARPPGDEAGDPEQLREYLRGVISRSFGDPRFPSNMDVTRVILNLCGGRWKSSPGGTNQGDGQTYWPAVRREAEGGVNKPAVPKGNEPAQPLAKAGLEGGIPPSDGTPRWAVLAPDGSLKLSKLGCLLRRKNGVVWVAEVGPEDSANPSHLKAGATLKSIFDMSNGRERELAGMTLEDLARVLNVADPNALVILRFVTPDGEILDVPHGGGPNPPAPPPLPQKACDQPLSCGFCLGSEIRNKWLSMGGEGGILGCPIMDEAAAARSPQGTTGRYAEFRGGDGGYIFWHGSGPKRGICFVVRGSDFKNYKSNGNSSSWLGFPLSDEYEVAGGTRQDFEGGYITWDAQTHQGQSHRGGDVAVTLYGLRWDIPCGSGGGDYYCDCKDPNPVQEVLGGPEGAVYDITLRFRGVAELKTYHGGTNDGRYWQEGGSPEGDTYNIYKLAISAPPQVYYLNRGTSGGRECVLIDCTKTIRMAAGATITLTAQTIDSYQIKNRDSAGNPIVVPGLGAYNGQFIQMDVINVSPVR